MSSLLLSRISNSAWKLNKSFLSSNKFRLYHSQNGVYGFSPKNHRRNEYQMDEQEIRWKNENPNLGRFVDAYRQHGHRLGTVDPLGLQKREFLQELLPETYALDRNDSLVSDVISRMEKIYCGNIVAEFAHLESAEERDWFASQYEKIVSEDLDPAKKRETAISMLLSEAFDNFLATKFPTVKRYGGEGAESCMGFYKEIFQLAAGNRVEHLVVCMAHRGRLNLLTGELNFPPALMFSKIKGRSELPLGVKGIGDVLSHLTSVTRLKRGDESVRVTLLPNPSHLEAANPVAVGRARGEQQVLKDGDYGDSLPREKVICLQVHGDAAVSGQGVVQETLAFSQVPHFSVGGSLHLIINNQVGYTTPSHRGRSSRYSSDIAKSINIPVIHVNGDDPESVIKAARVAFEYQRKFRRDVFVDVVCFRRWGHNELDDPTFTNPDIYAAVRRRDASVPAAYAKKLIAEGLLDEETVKAAVSQKSAELASAFREADSDSFVPPQEATEEFSQVGQAQARHLQPATSNITSWDSGVDSDVLRWVGSRSVLAPPGFSVHSNLQKTHIDSRLNKLKSGLGIDWSTAETLAIGSLLYQGFDVRISGQDVGRGTFSQRHAMLVDQATSEMYIPLNNLGSPEPQGHLEVANSILSEEAVLGFEYGMSISRPDLLCIWEAQFGDFFNGAQIMIDTFVTSGETKWQLQSGLVMLLPHGFDGAGPEHSSCRLERFLQLTDSSEVAVDSDDINMQVVNPTTPAQIFHLLRRQLVRPYRKPLIVAGPKMLLRFPAAVSSLQEMGPGTSFQPVIDDAEASKNPDNVKRVIFVSGKHYYAVQQQKQLLGLTDTAVVRLEELCPFPANRLQQLVNRYKNATQFVWSQEEARNGGAWNFVEPRFRNLVGLNLNYAGRPQLAAPAVGISAVHKAEAENLMRDTFKL